MTLRNYGKFEEELPCYFKTDISNMINFDSNTEKYQKITL